MCLISLKKKLVGVVSVRSLCQSENLEKKRAFEQSVEPSSAADDKWSLMSVILLIMGCEGMRRRGAGRCETAHS